MRFRDVLGLTFVSGSLLVAQPRQVLACGGCFHPPTPTNMSTVVTAHRMAFAFSSARTVLWDQIQYSGNPTDFSWVLPVKGDAKLESAEDAWFEALEAVSNTVVSPPQLDCYYQQNSGGCSCGSVSDSSAGFATAGAAGFGTGGGIIVLHEGSVGPYKFVQLRAADSQSLLQWLPDNGYVIPADIKPVIQAYQTEGFDFVALKLAPGMGTRQMTPVRVITPGASATLPLRMVAAGTGDFVGITLYVIAEGRYEAAGFNNNVTVDFSQLSWDWHSNFGTQGESNYGALRLQALAAGDRKSWLTSFAVKPGFTKSDYLDALGRPVIFSTNNAAAGGFGAAPPTFNNLTDLYFAQASVNANVADSCSTSKISDKLNGHLQVIDTCPVIDLDAGAAPGDAAAPPPSCPTFAASGKLAASALVCSDFSDGAAALIGMYPDDVWVTRLEANLPHAALAADLKISPAKDQKEVLSVHRAVTHINPPCDLLQNHPDIQVTANNLSPNARMQQAGVSAFMALGLLVARRAARRRARRTR
jgi:hypothetical protein